MENILNYGPLSVAHMPNGDGLNSNGTLTLVVRQLVRITSYYTRPGDKAMAELGLLSNRVFHKDQNRSVLVNVDASTTPEQLQALLAQHPDARIKMITSYNPIVDPSELEYYQSNPEAYEKLASRQLVPAYDDNGQPLDIPYVDKLGRPQFRRFELVLTDQPDIDLRPTTPYNQLALPQALKLRITQASAPAIAVPQVDF